MVVGSLASFCRKKGTAMDVYEIVTDRILDSLKAGVVPWRKPWSCSTPKNIVSGRDYRGINVLLLQSTPFCSPFWMTYRQAKALGGAVKCGVRGTPIVYWNVRETEEEGKKRNRAFLRYFTVFNLEQCNGIEAPAPIDHPPFNPIEACEKVVASYKDAPRIAHGGDRAFYLPAHDLVQLPPQGSFDRTEEYYSTLFHELVHSSGAAHRLARQGVVNGVKFASHAYSKEELVAEIGAAFLCAQTGIAPQTFENSHAYISFWMSALIHDSRMVIEASSHAAKAVDLILEKSVECVETSEEAA